jgi:hypothetical protein
MLISRLKQQKSTGSFFVARTLMATLASILLAACSAPVGTLYYGALAKGQSVIIISSAKTTANVGTNAVVSYDINGNFLDQIADLTSPNQRPRGIAPLDPFNILVALDGASKVLAKTSLFGSYSTFVPSTSFSGNLYQIAKYESGVGFYYTIVGNTIDAFDSTGARVSTTASPVIATTTGACVLNGPRGLFIDSTNKRMFVTNGGSTSLLVYDLTAHNAPICQTASSAIGAVNAVGVFKHSNGYVYVTSSTEPSAGVKLWALSGDGVGAATAVYTDTNGSVLNFSTAITELPDGNLLVANSGTNQIDRFRVDGLSAATRVGTTGFIKDVFTTLVTSIQVIRGM